MASRRRSRVVTTSVATRPAENSSIMRPHPSYHVSGRRGRDRHREPERGTLPRLTGDADLPPVRLDQSLADEQAQARAPFRAARDAEELLEQPLLVLRGNPRP